MLKLTSQVAWVNGGDVCCGIINNTSTTSNQVAWDNVTVTVPYP
jgi:hypothetical protein